ncbi:rCG41613, isoform CRA_b [Rattus norvegicus]|uniref:RCG41613, isoform CRA_b n=1 Tax=Rattus norvegicus TaxID=10116 RepID=A6IH43_RAT|nr:rCG41613, isoform CRA_b [Rattus norvegicus]
MGHSAQRAIMASCYRSGTLSNTPAGTALSSGQALLAGRASLRLLKKGWSRLPPPTHTVVGEIKVPGKRE